LLIYLDRFGNNSVETGVALNNLGVIECRLENFEEAHQLVEQAYKIRQHHYGEGHMYTVTAKANLHFIDKANKRAADQEASKTEGDDEAVTLATTNQEELSEQRPMPWYGVHDKDVGESRV
jgi:hypothetical protein